MPNDWGVIVGILGETVMVRPVDGNRLAIEALEAYALTD